MIQSMTGYGRAEQIENQYEILVEIKSVNHRYFELNQRIPRTYGYLEQSIKEMIKKKISRGKIDVFVKIYPLEKEETICVNRPIVQGYLQALRNVGREFQIPDDLTLTSIANLPDVFSVWAKPEQPAEIAALVLPVAEKALSQFLSSREKEGAFLQEDLLKKLSDLKELLSSIEKRTPSLEEEYRKRLTEKLQLVLEDRSIEESRILTEAALFANRSAVDEEMVRLESHLQQFKALLGQEGAVGKKSDFLIQEIHREINTLGSKIVDLEVTQTVLTMKSVLEMIREQIQNVE